jgi:hypothetical protein
MRTFNFPWKGENALIYVSKDQLKQVEYLINQSIQGNHILFDLDSVRRVFDPRSRRKPAFSEEEAYAVEHHIERLMLQPSLAEKRAYIEQLDGDTFAQVVKTYFCIVENNIYEQLEVHH